MRDEDVIISEFFRELGQFIRDVLLSCCGLTVAAILITWWLLS